MHLYSNDESSRENKTWPRAQAPDLVKVVERSAVLIQLLLADALSVTRQDLVLDLVDGSGNGGQQLLPSYMKVL